MEKKPRLLNFNISDNLLLCDIVTKYKNIIENKKSDGCTIRQKQQAWLDVVREFNASSNGYSRTVESLQQNYKNLKKKMKKKSSDAKMSIPVDRNVLIQSLVEYGTSSEGFKRVAEDTGASQEDCQNIFKLLGNEARKKEKCFKKNILGTGGGPPPRSDDDPLLDKVKALIGPSIEGLHTIYDGDSDMIALQHILPIELDNGDNIDSGKRKLASEMPQKQSVSTKFNILASEKLELVAMQKELIKCQLNDKKEKLQHNQLLRAMEMEDAKQKELLRAMEMEDAKKRYDHHELIRQYELKAFNQ